VQNSSQIITNHKQHPTFVLLVRCPSCRPTNSVKAVKGNVAVGICIFIITVRTSVIVATATVVVCENFVLYVPV